MKFLKILVLSAAVALSCGADAKGGFSGGGGRGGFSSGRSMSTPSAPSYSRPAMPAPSVQQARPNSAPSVMPGVNNRPVAAATQSRPVTTSTTTTTRSYSSRVSPGASYGGMGMGYGYYGSNGLLTGLIIGSMMHPHGTVVYSGAGAYSNNALLYPNGQIVDQNGRLIGTSVNGTFVPVQNGQIVAQQAPTDAYQQPAPQQVMVVQKAPETNYMQIALYVMIGIAVVVLLIALL